MKELGRDSCNTNENGSSIIEFGFLSSIGDS
jgi:hypothetical protein